MTYGYASDVPGDDTVMEYPVAELRVDSSQLTREQALTLGEIGDVEDEHAYATIRQNSTVDHSDMGMIEFHMSFEKAVQMLMAVGIIENPTDEPPTEVVTGE